MYISPFKYGNIYICIYFGSVSMLKFRGSTTFNEQFPRKDGPRPGQRVHPEALDVPLLEWEKWMVLGALGVAL